LNSKNVELILKLENYISIKFQPYYRHRLREFKCSYRRERDLITSLICTALFLMVWKPKTIWRFPDEEGVKANDTKYTSGKIFKAWSPFLIVMILMGLWGSPGFKSWVANDLQWFVNIKHWPGLDGLVMQTAPIVAKPMVYAASFKWDFFGYAGTAMLLSAIITMVILRISPKTAVNVFGRTMKQLGYSLITIMSVLGLAYLANYSGMSFSLGLAFASTGVLFPVFSPVLGWLGVFLTGSVTSSAALFGKLQQVTAGQLGLNPILTVSANLVGGVFVLLQAYIMPGIVPQIPVAQS